MSERVRAPSDIADVAQGDRVRVGGRVIAIGEGWLEIADAFAAIRIALPTPGPMSPGDLVVVGGIARGAVLESAWVIERIEPARSFRRAPPADPPDGEHDRLARGVGDALRARAHALEVIRADLATEGFLEVETPALVPSPGLDVHLDAFEIRDDKASAYLITSPEYQLKRLLVGGVPRCFELTHCFRRGEIGARHNPEFLMLEWYRAFAEIEEVMADTERLVRAVTRALCDSERITTAEVTVDLAQPFERLSVGEAFARHAGISADDAIALASSDEERFFRLLVDAVEPALALATRPIFLVDYPAPFASLARRKASDPRVCERFELYVAGVELCNGFGELTDPVEQRARLVADQAARRARGLPAYPIDERFLGALEEGMPPSAGNALGVDRLIALCLGGKTIADVLAFPAGWL